jgi:hypothetical protein
MHAHQQAAPCLRPCRPPVDTNVNEEMMFNLYSVNEEIKFNYKALIPQKMFSRQPNKFSLLRVFVKTDLRWIQTTWKSLFLVD